MPFSYYCYDQHLADGLKVMRALCLRLPQIRNVAPIPRSGLFNCESSGGGRAVARPYVKENVIQKFHTHGDQSSFSHLGK
jgi:hypothetical protein